MAPFGLSFPCSKISIICLMGVMPQIGSFENGKLYAMAPTRRSSMNTGEPDMPANTPVRSTPGPLSFARMVDWRGPVNPGRTPKISSVNSCGSLPAKTVRATPFNPGFTSSKEKSAVPAGMVFAAVLTAIFWPDPTLSVPPAAADGCPARP